MRRRSATKEEGHAARFPVSRYDAYVSLGSPLSDLHARCVLSFTGRIDADRLAEATRLVLEAEPVLASRFVRRSSWPYWEKPGELDDGKIFSIVAAPDVGPLVTEHLAAPRDPFAAPQVEVCLFRSERDLVSIKGSHVATDGAGLAECAYLLAAAYRALGGNPASFFPEGRIALDPDRLLERSSLPSLLVSLRRAVGPRLAWGFPVTEGDPADRGYAIRRIERERIADVKDFAARHSASVGEVLLTAFWRALFDLLDPNVGTLFPIRVPVSLRRYLPAGHPPVLRNFFGNVQPAIRRARGEAFAETLERVLQAIAPLKADRPGLAMVPFRRALFTLGYAPGQWAATRTIDRAVREGHSGLVFSNVGVLDSERLSFGDVPVIGAFILGPIAFAPSFCLAATTYQSAMTLSAGFSCAKTQRPLVEELLDRIAAELPF